MWLEAKLVLSIFALIFISIVMAQIILLNFFLGFLLLMGIGLVIMGDMLISYQIKHNHVDVLIDPCPPSHEICVLFDFSGNLDFIRSKKAPLGKREFVKYKKEASVINVGDYPLRFINGNHGFFGHESYDKNVNMMKAEALDKLEGDNIEEIMDNLSMEDRAGVEVVKDAGV